MDDSDKTKAQLITELAQLRQKVAELKIAKTEYKQVKEALQASEIQYRRLFEAAKDGILILEAATGKITAVNPFLTDLLGYSEKEILGQRLWEIGPFKNTQASKAAFQELQRKEYIRYEDLPLETRDGRSISVEFVSNVYLTGHKEVIQCNIRDITERVRVEKALRDSEAGLKFSQQVAHVGHWTWNTVSNTVIWSDEMYRIFGLDPATFDGDLTKIIEQAIHPDDREKVNESNSKVLTEQKPEPLEYRVIWPDQSVHTVWAEAGQKIFDAHGKIIRLSGIVQDITERKQAGDTVRLQSFALNAAVNAIVITDRAGLIQWVNQAYCDLTGYTAAEAMGKNLRELVKSNQHDQTFYKDMWDTILSGQAWHGEVINRRKDGSLYTEEQDITPVRDSRGEISHFIAVKQDITQRKQLEAENKQLAEQFYQAQKMETIGLLAGSIAHDFNNLLVPIIGYTELGMLTLTPDNQLYADLERIKAAAERAAELTRQILAFSRQQVLEMKTLDLNMVISEFGPMLRSLLRESIALQMNLRPGLLLVKADKGQFEQVVLNLVVNARDAMLEGGTLIIETAQVILDEAYAAKHLGARPGPHVMLAVTDTGHGMDAATRQRIFEPFFTTKELGQGTGLGLATVFGIIKQHQGNIWVYSEPGRGTTFKIHLPLADAPALTEEPADPDIDSLQGTETVLVVEDDAIVRQLVVEMLEMYGYHILAAEDPVKGLALAATHKGHIDLLLTDVIMPHLHGPELYRQLALVRPELKVLYMSGYPDTVIAQQEVLGQVNIFLQKPFGIIDLVQKVRTALG